MLLLLKDKARKVSDPLSIVILYLAAFPFVVPVFSRTDTQPTFALVFLAVSTLFATTGMARTLTLEKTRFLLVFSILFISIAIISVNVMFFGADVQFSRIGSFGMFVIGIFAGVHLARLQVAAHHILIILYLYVVFTVIFFLTGGMIEERLIQSREMDFSELANIGRGASTLSPEPSFFAFQIFSLFIVANLILWDVASDAQKQRIQKLTIGLLLSSFGGFGAIYTLLIIGTFKVRYVIAVALAGIAVVVVYFDSVEQYGTRLFVLLQLFLRDGSSILEDASVASRLTSFLQYLEIFLENPVFGDGFSHIGGGGFVSLIASMGISWVVVLILVGKMIIDLKAPKRIKNCLIAWFILQFLSGPLGIPFVGVTLGLLLGLIGLDRRADERLPR